MPGDFIRSRAHPAVRRLQQLKRETGRAKALALIEGPKLLEEAVAARMEVVEVAVSPRGLTADRGRSLIETVRLGGAAVRLMDEAVLATLSEVETSQGVLAVARRPVFDESEIYRTVPLILVAIALQNPGNLGALIRTAEAAGATGAYLTKGTADPFSWKALRGSMGSAFRLPQVSGLTASEVLKRLRARGVRLVAAAAGAEQSLHDADLHGPTAFLIGNEGAGLPDDLLRAADRTVFIPMAGQVESLNASVAAGILLFEAARQRSLRCSSSDR